MNTTAASSGGDASLRGNGATPPAARFWTLTVGSIGVV